MESPQYTLVRVYTEYEIDGPKSFTTRISPSPNSPLIKFLISYTCINRVWAPPFLLSDTQHPSMHTAFAVGPHHFSIHEDQLYASIVDKIRPWPMSDGARKELLDKTIRFARLAVEALPAEIHNVRTGLTVVRNHVVRPAPITAAAGSCGVCLEEISEACEGVYIPCSHVFHQDCIKKWLRITRSCPLCRFQMPTGISYKIDF